MKYPASEKPEIIGMFEQSHFSKKRTLAMLGLSITSRCAICILFTRAPQFPLMAKHSSILR